eukprot:1152764-Pelagomonas_calceolata.AAC.3
MSSLAGCQGSAGSRGAQHPVSMAGKNIAKTETCGWWGRLLAALGCSGVFLSTDLSREVYAGHHPACIRGH